MISEGFAGWDLGGAHLKVASLNNRGQLVSVCQLDCPLWRGLPILDDALNRVLRDPALSRCVHAITMTGELADIFPDRVTGVQTLVSRFTQHMDGEKVFVFAGRRGLVTPERTACCAADIASANWYASASFTAAKLRDAMLIDVGSTTTDIVLLEQGQVTNHAYNDGLRLQTDELVYTGVARTPVMAVTKRVPFAGEWQTLAAEVFATTADVYVLTGALSQYPERAETADGAGKQPADCARRLARMLGRDLEEPSDLAPWRRLAHYIAGVQRDTVRRAVERILSRSASFEPMPFVGAGSGRFLVSEVAGFLAHSYVDFAELVPAPVDIKQQAAVCAPAVALAYLLRSS